VTTASSPERYRRRNRWPVVIVLVLLLTAAGVIWYQALRPAAAEATGCNQPGPAPATSSATSRSTRASASGTGGSATKSASGSTRASTSASRTTSAAPTSTPTSLGEFTDMNTLANIRPADPSLVQLRVYNGSNTRGLARTVTEQLRTAGFESVQSPDNDPLYPANDLRCIGEIRYGPAGAAAARTVLIVAPCAQLVVDRRVDDSVDLSLGARWEYAEVSDAVTAELAQIHESSRPPAVIEGQTASAQPLPAIPPLPQVTCPA